MHVVVGHTHLYVLLVVAEREVEVHTFVGHEALLVLDVYTSATRPDPAEVGVVDVGAGRDGDVIAAGVVEVGGDSLIQRCVDEDGRRFTEEPAAALVQRQVHAD